MGTHNIWQDTKYKGAGKIEGFFPKLWNIQFLISLMSRGHKARKTVLIQLLSSRGAQLQRLHWLKDTDTVSSALYQRHNVFFTTAPSLGKKSQYWLNWTEYGNLPILNSHSMKTNTYMTLKREGIFSGTVLGNLSFDYKSRSYNIYFKNIIYLFERE